MGSNFSGPQGFSIDQFKAKLQAIEKNISGNLLRESLFVAANVFRDAIEAATPTGHEDGYRYGKKTGGEKSRRTVHHAGQARQSVIVYERKKRGRLSYAAADASLLIGHEKRKAYYMYWYEYGRKNQVARAFMKRTCDSAEPAAWDAVQKLLAAALNRTA